ncbi:MAG TPA: hypothetical protein DCF49_10020 [Lachnospiraceae bacterium]|nr:hypothetical protein [Lachnospiraceae bacterium]
MKGLELSRAFYREYGEPMLREKFPELIPFLAVGLTGSGSECYGFDDEVSQDHDFEPGFCIFVPGEEVVGRKAAFALERAYAALPREFMGLKRSLVSPTGGARHGVLRMADFMKEKTGTADGNLSLWQWLSVPEYALAEAVNGEIFADPYGELTGIRERLRNRPRDIRIKKLAGQLLLMAQSGQYNYGRCLRHGETAAAQLAVMEFVKSTMAAVFLLNDVYQPYYKWSFRAMRALPRLALTAELLEYLMTTDNEEETREEKSKVIEGIASDVIGELRAQGLTRASGGELEAHAYSVHDKVADVELRNMHILAAV